MGEITTVGLDLAKRVVSVCGENASGRVVMRRTLRREAVLAWFVQRPACVVGMEACACAHWFARELEALGHQLADNLRNPFDGLTRRGHGESWMPMHRHEASCSRDPCTVLRRSTTASFVMGGVTPVVGC